MRCFTSQTYPYKELVILDDGDEPSFPRTIGATVCCHSNNIMSEFHNSLTIDGVPVHYIRTNPTKRYSVWEKRNRCCDLARGELIAHFDSDDWSDPQRLTYQVAFMGMHQKAVTGFNRMMFFEPASGRVAQYAGGHVQCPALGTSLVYRKSFWMAHPYVKPARGETGSDNVFARTARDENQIAVCDAASMMVARLHGGRMNASQSAQKIGAELPISALPEGFPRI